MLTILHARRNEIMSQKKRPEREKNEDKKCSIFLRKIAKKEERRTIRDEKFINIRDDGKKGTSSLRNIQLSSGRKRKLKKLIH